MSDAVWYYANGADRKGPVTADAIKALVEAGAISASADVWREGQAEWEPAYRHIPGVVPPAPGQRIASQPAPRPRAAMAGQGYGEGVSFGQAFGLFWSNYANFSGRSPRSAFWWWALWAVILGSVATTLDYMFVDMTLQLTPFGWAWSLVTLIPSLALGARRLHDVNRSGWWQLIALTVVGIIVLIVWYLKESDPGPNDFG